MSHKKHGHYFKTVEHLTEVDVYRVCELFQVDDCSGATHHAIKKLLLPGQRGAGKSRRQDLQEAVDTLKRRIAMYDEDDAAAQENEASHEAQPALRLPVESAFPPVSIPLHFTQWFGIADTPPVSGQVHLILRNGDRSTVGAEQAMWRHQKHHQEHDILAYLPFVKD